MPLSTLSHRTAAALGAVALALGGAVLTTAPASAADLGRHPPRRNSSR